MKTITATRVIYDSGSRIALAFTYDEELIIIIRQIPGARWSKRLHAWHIPDQENIIGFLLEKFRKKAFIDYSALRREELVERARSKSDETRPVRGSVRGPVQEPTQGSVQVSAQGSAQGSV